MFPSWTHPFLSLLLPSYWSGQGYLKSAKALLGPKLRELIHKNDEGSWSPEGNEEDFNVLAWLADTAKGGDRNPETLAHVEVLLALASVHTTLLRVVNVLYDLTANPECVDHLREEIESVWDAGWDESSYARLHKLDSVLRESQRMSPPTVLGLKRLFKQPYTFSTGLHIPQGTYVALPTMAIENDPDHTADPETFDGLRSYRLLQGEIEGGRGKESSNHQFSSFERTVLNFGYGKSACPGRYFASLIVKIVFVKLLTEYDFQFVPGTGRPKNYVVHEFLFPWPWEKILVKRRVNGACPF
jgi:cytochrome P450